MNRLKELFNYDELKNQTFPLVAENFIFKPDLIDRLEGFQINHQEKLMIDDPLALINDIYLDGSKNEYLNLKLILCWNGYGDALKLLFRLANSFSRAIPYDEVFNISKEYDIGNFGLAWDWKDYERFTELVYFIRNNILVIIKGNSEFERFKFISKDIDRIINDLKTVEKYKTIKEGFFSDIKKNESIKVKTGNRIDLGKSADKELLFFLTTSGSVNRDIDHPDLWYYRAGLETGKQIITLFRIKEGLLPEKETLNVEIFEESD